MKKLSLISIGLLILNGCGPKSKQKTDINYSLFHEQSSVIEISDRDKKIQKTNQNYTKCGNSDFYVIYDGELFTGIIYTEIYDSIDELKRVTEVLYKEGKKYGYIKFDPQTFLIKESVSYGDTFFDGDSYEDDCYVVVRKYDKYGEMISDEVEHIKDYFDLPNEDWSSYQIRT